MVECAYFGISIPLRPYPRRHRLDDSQKMIAARQLTHNTDRIERLEHGMVTHGGVLVGSGLVR